MGQSPDGSTYSDEPSDYILVQGNADLQNGWVCPRIWTTQITKKADAGDLIMSVRAPAGAMGKTAYNAVIGRGVAAIKGNEFIYQLLVKMDMDGFWKTLSCGSTFESLNSDNIKNAEVKVPTTAEQVQIGDFFRHLDNLITLHQRQPFLHSTPEISLTVQLIHPFYTSSWEQRKVGDLIEDYIEKTIVQNQYPVLTSSQQQGIVLQEDYFADRQVTTNDNIGYYVLPRGYFTYRSRSDTDMFVFNRNNIINKGIISYYYPVFLPKNCDSNFLLRRLNHGIRKQLSMAAEGTGQKVLAHNKFKNMVVDVPSTAEQCRIGIIFEMLDNLITLHQRKGKAAVTGCSNDANNSKCVYCRARDFGYKCYKEVKSQQIRCLIAVFIFCV